MQQRNSWCESCGSISPIECLGESFWNYDADDHAEVKLIVDRLRLRTSSCLRCRSEVIEIPESDYTNNLLHPPCGGFIEAGSRIDAYCPVYYPQGHWYSPEGELLKKGFYWHSGKGVISKDLDFPIWIEPRDYGDDEWSWEWDKPK